MPTKRMERIEEEIKRALSAIIRNDVKDDRLSPITSVTGVKVTSDLKYAKVYASVYNDSENKRKASIDALNHAAPFIRTMLSRAVDIRRVPEMTFILDDSIEYGLKIAKVLEDVKKNERSSDTD